MRPTFGTMLPNSRVKQEGEEEDMTFSLLDEEGPW
jgi:hypothetical protein